MPVRETSSRAGARTERPRLLHTAFSSSRGVKPSTVPVTPSSSSSAKRPLASSGSLSRTPPAPLWSKKASICPR